LLHLKRVSSFIHFNFVFFGFACLRNENFAGVDSLRLSTKNKNGINHLDVPVFVEPVNDPPFINVPQYIMLESNGSESLIFHPERDKFNFSVGDPDLVNFPGNVHS